MTPAEHEEPMTGPPDTRLAQARYAEHAERYDSQTDWAAPDRAAVVALLDLRAGDVVVDVGCGTGLCFEAILERIGPEGALIGVEPCAEMLDRARRRVAGRGWHNVELLHDEAAGAVLPAKPDAALLCFTHDVLRAPAALQNVLGQLRPGGRVATVGPMWAPWWAPAVNMAIWYVASQYVTTFEGFSEPWSRLAELVPDLDVDPRPLSGVFFASGTWPG